MAYTLQLKMLTVRIFQLTPSTAWLMLSPQPAPCTDEERQELMIFVTDDDGSAQVKDREIDRAYQRSLAAIASCLPAPHPLRCESALDAGKSLSYQQNRFHL